MKKIVLTFYILCLTCGVWAQLPEPPLADSIQNASQSDFLPDSIIEAPVQQSWPGNVVERLDRLMEEPLLKKTQLGLMVYDLTADSAIYRHGEKQTLRPASIMKVVTAVAALDRLGGNHKFRTLLYYKGQVADSVLKGDVYCVGGMDPLFDADDMKAFADSLRSLGITSISGRLIADTSMKDDTRLGEGWCWDDDNPTLTPLLIAEKDEFLRSFANVLRGQGIRVDSTLAEGVLPSGAVRIGSRSHLLEAVLQPMMKDSRNLYAEAMAYRLAASGGTRRASYAQARQYIRKLVGRLGLNAGEYKFADGSGLSLYNYVSAELMVSLLRYAYQNPRIYSSLYPSLPIAGQDGTLEKRMTDPVTRGRVRAKTGTLTGVSSLAGYCWTANNHLLCFCIINQGVMRNASGRDFQDKVCRALCLP